MPEMDDGLGTSLVLVHSDRGQQALDRISGGLVECREVDVEAAIERNPYAVRSVRPHPKRDVFCRDLNRLPLDRLVDEYCRTGIAERVKERIASGVRRVLRGLRFTTL